MGSRNQSLPRIARFALNEFGSVSKRGAFFTSLDHGILDIDVERLREKHDATDSHHKLNTASKLHTARV